MQKTNDVKNNILKCVIRYALIFIAVLITPWIAQPIAKLFDWVALDWSDEGLLRPLFVELFTAFFWMLEWAAFLVLDGHFKKQDALKMSAEQDENATETSQPVAEAAVTDSEKANNVKKTKKKSEPLFPKTPLLPMKNVVILFAITAACILLVTLQIGLKVKPFYELGDKTTYVKIIIKGGEIIRNLVKGMWIVCILRTALMISEEIVNGCKEKMANWQENQVTLLKWSIVLILTLAFGLFDVIYYANPFALTYVAFYVAFTAIYFFTKQAPIKSYLLICFIYIF